METVIVTGAAGFLGSHLAEFYLNQGYFVIGVDNYLTSGPRNIELLQGQYENFKFIKRDAKDDWSPLKELLQGSLAYVFHFASPASPEKYQRFPFETMAVNTEGLLNGLKFSQENGGRLVFSSSSEVYGSAQVTPQPETYFGYVNPFGPRACYNGAKRLGESVIFEFNRLHQGHHGAVRIFNTYGPRMDLNDGRVVINLLVQAQRSLPLTIYGDGSQTRSFCYVDDLVLGISKYAESNLTRPINIGNPSEITILDLAAMVQKLYPSRELTLQFASLPVDDPLLRKPDISEAWTQLQWRPEIGLDKGLEIMKGWLVNQESSALKV